MGLKKYQKEYERFAKITRKANKLLWNLYESIKKDEKLLDKKDFSFVLSSLESYISSFADVVEFLNDVDITDVRDIKPKPLNNLLILPLFPDEDICVNPNEEISYIFNCPKE